MAKPRAFLSSTYIDLRDLRDTVGAFLRERGFTVRQFERGGVFFDPNLPLDESCYQEVHGCDLFVMIIGGRYGSPASEDTKPGRKYTSITRKELETAIDQGIPVLVFVRSEVNIEYKTWRNTQKRIRETIPYSSVDSTQVFTLLEQIYLRKRGNPVFQYENPSDVANYLGKQLSGLLAHALKEKRDQSKTAKVKANGFKLFFFRDQKRLSQNALAKKSGVRTSLISRLERVDLNSSMTLGEHLFQATTRKELEKIERVLDCGEALEAGQADDFLGMYIHYYGLYKKSGNTKRKVEAVSEEELFPTKSLVLDFDGTLTLRSSDDDMTTWERLWVAAGYSVNDTSELARKYVVNGRVTPEDHKAWCSETCKRFVAKGFTKSHLLSAADGVRLVPGVDRILRELRKRGVSLFLISGSIRDIIRKVLGSTYELFDEVHANDFVFDECDMLIDIRGTRYDFEGKGKFIKGIIEKQDVSPLEVLFIGNSLNDVWASNAGARTLCVNPHFINPNEARDWTYCLRRMEDFSKILPFLGPPTSGVKNGD